MNDPGYNLGKRVNQEEINAQREQEWQLAIEKLNSQLRIKYGLTAEEPIPIWLELDLTVIHKVFVDLASLQGKRILDLGCGSMPSETGGRQFEPWLCRALKELGANPVGIDVGQLDTEEFEHYQLDLSKIGALNIFPDKSFDAVNLAVFFNSPKLKHMIEPNDIKRIKQEIGNQVKRLLKDNGSILTLRNYVKDDIKSELGL